MGFLLEEIKTGIMCFKWEAIALNLFEKNQTLNVKIKMW